MGDRRTSRYMLVTRTWGRSALSVAVAVTLVGSWFLLWPKPSKAADPPAPEAIRLASWPLDGNDTSDVVGDNDLTLSGASGSEYDWVEDWVCFPESALELHGSLEGYAATARPAIATDASFSLTVLVLPGATVARDQTVLSQAGAGQPAVLLQQTAEGSWRFAVPSLSPVRPESGVVETGTESLRQGVWNHLTGVVDVPGREIRLSVNGELAAAGELPASRRAARGPFYVGVEAKQSMGSPFGGTIDKVGVWSGPLSANQIRDLAAFGGGQVPNCF